VSCRIVIDVCLSPRWVDLLTANGHQAVHWTDIGDPHASDQEIMRWASDHDHIVFTHDLDFAAILALSQAGRPSVLQLRGRRVLPDQIGLQVIFAFKQYADDLNAGALVVVDPQRSRVRILPLDAGK
jgi:predicted nuclease of predicted toxin-antitoxin system